MKAELQKPVYGIDQLADETAIEPGYVRSAVNVDIDAEGNVYRRNGYRPIISGKGFHSLFAPKRGGLILCKNGELGFLSNETFNPLATLTSNYRLSYTELNDCLYCFSSVDAIYFPPDSMVARLVGVPLPVYGPTYVTGAGSLHEGEYAIAYSIVDDLGEESPLSKVEFMTLSEGSSITVTGLPPININYTWRIYMSEANGEQLRQAIEFSAGNSSATITKHQSGRQPKTKDLEVLPSGYHVRAYDSRLFVATKDAIYFSCAFRPHLYNPAHDYILVSGHVSFIEPVDEGIFVGDQSGVKFYQGTSPDNFKVEQVSEERAVFGASQQLAGEMFDEPFDKFDRVALWMTSSGYQLGLPSGEVVRLHANRVRLPNYQRGCMSVYFDKGRKQVITSVNSNSSEGFNTAVDSNLE